jgi:hypothetical protein
MTATAKAPAGAKAARPRPTQAQIAAKDAQIAALQAQLQAQPVAVPAPVNGNGSHAAPAAGIPEILKFTTADADDEPEARAPLFSVNGVEYTIPAEPRLDIGLRASRILARSNPSVAESRAMDYVLTAMLGEDGYDALLSVRKLDMKAFALIVATCQERTIGQVETPKDGSRTG